MCYQFDEQCQRKEVLMEILSLSKKNRKAKSCHLYFTFYSYNHTDTSLIYYISFGMTHLFLSEVMVDDLAI